MAYRPAPQVRLLPRFVLPSVVALALTPPGGLTLIAMSLLGVSFSAHAQPAALRTFEIPAGTLEDTLNRFGRESGILLSFSPQTTAGLRSPGVRGAQTARSGLDALLVGTGVQAVPQLDGTYQLRRQATAIEVGSSDTLPTVTVTGAADERGGVPKAYAGGQIARGGRVGLLGDRDVMDTPFSTTNYTAEFIENQQARSVIDVLANDPSVVLGWPSDSYVDQYNVRGFSMLGEDTTYGGLYGIAPPGKTPMELVERVEVVKGMSAFLRGISPAGSLGATINMTPKRATDRPINRLTATYDSTSHIGGHLDVGRRFGSDGEVGIRVNGVYRDGETVRRGSAKEMGTAAVAFDYRGSMVRASLDAGFDKLNVERGGYWYFLDSNRFAIPRAPETRQNTSQLWNRVNNSTKYAMGRVEVDLSDTTTAYAAVGESRYDLRAHLPEPIITNAAGDFTEYFQLRAVERRSTTGELGLRSQVRTGWIDHTITATATTLDQTTHGDRVFVGEIESNLYQPTYVPEPAFFGNPVVAARFANLGLQSRSKLNSFALADEISLWEGRVLLMGGVRRQSVDVGNFSLGRQTATYNKAAWTAGGGVVVKPADGVSLYANYMEGLNQGPVAPTTAANGGEIFAPYKSKQYEAGVKFDAGNLLATLGVFQVARPNGQTDSITRIYSLDGEQRNRGIEFGLVGEAVKGLRVMAGAMLLDAKLTRTQGGSQDGKRAVGAPRHNVRLGGEWDPSFLPGVTLSSRINRSASQYVDSGNLQSIPSWTTVDIGGRYSIALADGKRLTMRADVRNVADKAYWASSIGAWLNAGAGRTVSLSASFDF